MSIRSYILRAVSLLALTSFTTGYVHAESLQEALMSAYTSNPSLMAERERVREFDENYVQARAQGLMTSTLSGTYSWSGIHRHEEPSPLSGISGKHNDSKPKSLQLQVIQPIYQGGRVKALKAQAKAGILAARQGLRNAEQSIFLSTASAYSDVIAFEEAARIRRNSVSVLARQRQAAQDRFEVGEGTRTDIAQADSRLAAAEIGLAQADAQLEVARASYNRATGHMPEALQMVPEFLLPQNITEAVRIGRENNPQLIAAVFNEDAAMAGIDVAKSVRRPTFSINATAQGVQHQLTGLDRGETATIAAQVSIPLLSGGLNSSRIRAANAASARSRFETRDIERAVDQAVTQSWAQMEAADRSIKAAQRQVEAAEFAFEGVKLEQEVGTRTALDVLNAEQEVLEAKLAVINSRSSYEKTVFELLAIIGAFDAERLQLPLDRYDPSVNFDEVNQKWFTERAVDDYVPEVIEKIARQVPNIPQDIANTSLDLIEETKIPEVTGKFLRQVPDIPHDILVGTKKTIDNPADIPINIADAPIGLVSGAGKVISQVPNIPKDIASGTKTVFENITGQTDSEDKKTDESPEN